MDFNWIEKHIGDDPLALCLKYGGQYSDEILQVQCRRKYADKLRDALAADTEFIFPTALSGEQSTSCRLAQFHTSLAGSAGSVVDLTAGLGIDAMTMARAGHKVTAIERADVVADALRHNARNLDVTVVTGDCRDFVRQTDTTYDTVFIDPARRASDGSRVFALGDCEPDVLEMLPDIKRIARRLIIKASPMLDITHTIRSLPVAASVYIVGTSTECKELVVDCNLDKPSTGDCQITAVSLTGNEDIRFGFVSEDEAAAEVSYGIPQVGDYLHDPYPAVMKSGGYKVLGARFSLKKLAPNTHLWYADSQRDCFPGRAYKVTDVIPFASKHIKRYASAHPRVSVTTRNFDIQAQALVAKLRVKEGAERLFAVSDSSGNRWLLTCSPSAATSGV